MNPPARQRQAKGRLFDRLCDSRTLGQAWQAVLGHYRQGRLPPELAAFELKRGREIARVADLLRARRFTPDFASLVRIPKPARPGEFREISLLTPDDRLVLTALNSLLEPLFDRQFCNHSYAYRKGRSALKAVERAEHCLRQGVEHVALGDIEAFFDSIDRVLLFDIVRKTVWEEPLLNLIETYLHIGSAVNMEATRRNRGIAQGSPVSPLLSNVYLAGFDLHLEACGVEWVRYADNILLLAQEPGLVREAFERAEKFLNTQRNLTLSQHSRVFSNWENGFEFLGFWLQGGRRTMSPSRLNQKRQTLAAEVRKHRRLPDLVESLSETAIGWRNYYGSSPDAREQLRLLEQHLFEVLVDWMRRYRTEGAGKAARTGELKATLAGLELPHQTDRRKRTKWVELLLARSRPQPDKPSSPMSELARKAIEKRRAQLRSRKGELSDVVVSGRGTYLGRSGERLVIRREGKRESELPLSMVKNITLLTTAASISVELMRETSARGIGIHVLGDDGKPAVRIGPFESTLYDITAAQAALAGKAGGLELAAEFVRGKIRNQLNLLRYFGKNRRRRRAAEFFPAQQKAIAEMETLLQDLRGRTFRDDLDLERNRLFATEGQAAMAYWAALKALSGGDFGFQGRVRRGAGDLVNVLLNYGYGILYSRLLQLLYRTGLNVNIGFLHKARAGKPVLLYDLIEEFRPPCVDRVVFGLLSLGKKFTIADGRLADNGRHALSRAVQRRLRGPTRYRSERITMEEAMEEQARLLRRHLEGKDDYRSWVWQW